VLTSACDAPLVGGTGDGEVALAVGAVQLHAGPREDAHRRGRGMPVGVVGTDRDQSDPRPGCREEARIGVGAAVVRHLEHVGAQVDPVPDQPRLHLRAQIAGEQHAHPALGDPDDHREVVGGGRPRGPPRVGRQDLDRGRSHAPAGTGDQGRPGAAVSTDQGVESRAAVVGGRERRRRHHPRLPPGQRAGQAGRVVGVQVREQYEWQRVDAEPVEAAVDRADVGPGVDEDPAAAADGQHEGVPLPHVARDDDGVRRWPAADQLPQRPADDHQPDQRRQSQRAQRRPPPQRPADGQQQQREQHRTAGAGRPAGGGVRERRGPFGDQHQPAGGPPGHPEQRLRDRSDERLHQERH
jgi:hypothetical protein